MTEITDKFGGVRWDGTINLGTIIAMIGIAGPLIIGSVTVINKVGNIETTVMAQGEKFDQRLKSVEEITQSIRLDMAKQETVRTVVADHEARLRALENRG